MFRIKKTEIIGNFKKMGALDILIFGITIFRIHYDFKWDGNNDPAAMEEELLYLLKK